MRQLSKGSKQWMKESIRHFFLTFRMMTGEKKERIRCKKNIYYYFFFLRLLSSWKSNFRRQKEIFVLGRRSI